MKNPFARKGFDSLISKGVSVSGDLTVLNGQVVVIDGSIVGSSLAQLDEAVVDTTTVMINGDATVDLVKVSNVTVMGALKCKLLHVEGQLAVKANATITADEILYRQLIIEPGAVVLGRMGHLDHISAGEQL